MKINIILLITTSLILLILISLEVILHEDTKNGFINQRIDTSKSLSEFYTSEITNPLYFGDLKSLKKITNNIIQNPQITSVYVLTPKGDVLTDGTDSNLLYSQPLTLSSCPIIQSTQRTIQVTDNYICVLTPIVLSDHIGFLLIHSSLDDINLILEKEISSFILSIGVLSFLLIITNVIANKFIVLPILQLKHVTREIAKGNLGTKAEVSGSDEISGLAESFNKMGESLQKSILYGKNLEIFNREKNDLLLVLDEFALVSITDIQGNIIYTNEKFCEISKYSSDELIGQNHRILKSGNHPESFYKNLWDIISAGKIWKNVVQNKAKDGSHYWVQTIIAPIFGNDGKIEKYISIRIDITKNKENEETIKSQYELLKKVENEKGEFLAMITHELRSPLTPIVGWCDALKNPSIMAKLDEKQSKAVDTILNNSLRLQKLISDLLDSQKLDMGKMAFDIQEFSTFDLMNLIKNNFVHSLKSKNIVLDNLTKDKINLKSDEKRIEQVLTNLINNAIDFVSQETGKIEINCKNEVTDVVFEVNDNGPGIEKEKQKLLFKKFYQADTSLRREHGGTGLGLSICKGIVEGLGGQINVKSEIGKGTSFYFRIPKK